MYLCMRFAAKHIQYLNEKAFSFQSLLFMRIILFTESQIHIWTSEAPLLQYYHQSRPQRKIVENPCVLVLMSFMIIYGDIFR